MTLSHTSAIDTQPTRPAILLDDAPTLILDRGQAQPGVEGLRPLVLLLAMVAGALMWAGLFLLLHTLIQMF